MKRGDFVWIEQGGRRIQAMVTIASSNGKSLMVMFDGMVGGYAGMMPLLRDDDGEYRDLLKNEIVSVSQMERKSERTRQARETD